MAHLRRFFAPPEQWLSDRVLLDAEETHHLARVLRLMPGARVEVADGQGRVARARIHTIEALRTVLHLEEELPVQGESPLWVTLGVGLAKGEALEQVVRQATELGIRRLVPFLSAYSEKISPERAHRRLRKLQRQARESLKSCQRRFLPEIAPLAEFSQVLSGPEERKVLFYEEYRQGGLSAALSGPSPRGVRLLIGPEGGFTAAEVAQAREAGFEVLSLGPRRLRVETAALTALAILQYAWGDLG